MKLKDHLAYSRFSIMQIRARGLPAVRENILANQVKHLENLLHQEQTMIIDIARQRDDALRMVLDLREQTK